MTPQVSEPNYCPRQSFLTSPAAVCPEASPQGLHLGGHVGNWPRAKRARVSSTRGSRSPTSPPFTPRPIPPGVMGAGRMDGRSHLNPFNILKNPNKRLPATSEEMAPPQREHYVMVSVTRPLQLASGLWLVLRDTDLRCEPSPQEPVVFLRASLGLPALAPTTVTATQAPQLLTQSRGGVLSG